MRSQLTKSPHFKNGERFSPPPPQDGLHNIAKAGYAKPDYCSKIGEQPPVLGQEKSEGTRV